MIWGFKNTSGDEVFLLDSFLIERHSRLRGRDAGGFRSHGHNHGLWKHGKSRRSKGFLEQILISCKSLRSVAVGFCGYANHNAFSQNHHLQANKSRQFFLKPLFSLFVMYSCFHKNWEIFISLFIIRVNISPYKMTGPWEFEKKKAASARQRCANISSPFWGTKNLGKGEELKPKTCWFGWGLVSLFRWLTWLGFWEVAFFLCPKKPSVVINARRKRITA